MRLFALFIFLVFSQNSWGDDKISKDVLESAFRNAANLSKPDSSDYIAYSKLIRGNFKNSTTRSKLVESDYKNVVQIKKITLGITDLIIFKEKSIKGTLFIANSKGFIIFSAAEWAEEFSVKHPFQGKYYFAISKTIYNDNTSNDNQNRKIYHVFQLTQDGTLVNILSYTDSINYCIHNNLLPTDVKKEVEEQKKFYTACNAKSSIKRFSNRKVEIDFTFTFNQDFLNQKQYDQTLAYFKIPKSGKKTFNWVFERDKDNDKYLIHKGNEVSPIDASNLAIKNY